MSFLVITPVTDIGDLNQMQQFGWETGEFVADLLEMVMDQKPMTREAMEKVKAVFAVRDELMMPVLERKKAFASRRLAPALRENPSDPDTMEMSDAQFAAARNGIERAAQILDRMAKEALERGAAREMQGYSGIAGEIRSLKEGL